MLSNVDIIDRKALDCEIAVERILKVFSVHDDYEVRCAGGYACGGIAIFIL